MTLSPKTLRISIALLVSLVFIAAGYYFSSPLRTSIANATSTEELLKAYAAKDTDSDGLPDWKEALYGTDPANAHSVAAAKTDSEAVEAGLVSPKFQSATTTEESSASGNIPGTAPKSGSLTERFAREFFTKFLLSAHPGAAPTEAELQAFLTDAIASLDLSNPLGNTYSLQNITISGTGSSALAQYALAFSAILESRNAQIKKDELSYIYDAVVNNDAEALKKMKLIASFYKENVEKLRKTPSPSELADLHLQLINSLARLGTAVEEMSTFNEDPVKTLLGIQHYRSESMVLTQTLAKIHSVFQSGNVTSENTEGAQVFLKLIERASTVSSSGTTTP